MRILIADDSAPIRYNLSKHIGEWGYDVTVACDGREAWEAIVSDRDIRIAIVDWHMPELDGPELCARIRGLGGERYLYVMMLTSVSASEGFVTGMESGADHYLHKSSSLDQIAAHLKVARRIVELQLRAIEDGRRIARAEQFESIAALARELAHELNTPFQYVANNLEFLHRELRGVLEGSDRPDETSIHELEADLVQSVHQSMEGIARMARIIAALQALAPDTMVIVPDSASSRELRGESSRIRALLPK